MRRSLAGFDGPPQGVRKARFFGLSRKVSGETCGGLTRLENHVHRGAGIQAPDSLCLQIAGMKAAAVPESTGIDAARLIRDHQVGVWRYLRALGCDPPTADDLTQDTFLAVIQRTFEEYSPEATSAYLRRTAFNLFIDWQRRNGRLVPMEALEQLSETWTNWAGNDEGDRLLTALQDCLDLLPERTRKALELRFRERCTRPQIAAALQMSEHGARNLMQRAKQKLRSCIEGKLK